jgi:hypothetical protein
MPVVGILAFLILSCPAELENGSGTLYTVTFETNGGSFIPLQYVAAHAKAKAPSVPSKEGSILTGWYDSPDFASRYYFDTPVTADITLYAKWEAGTALDTRTFYAQRMDDGKFYQLQADLLAEGQYCKIWVEQNPKGSVSPALAWAIADEYDGKIYPRMIEAFDTGPGYLQGTGSFNNTMELADKLTDDKDGKLSILLLDIEDGYTEETGSYVGGYFWSGNFYEGSSSNNADMIYLDTYPGRPGEANSNKTLAHEMQHLMNHVSSIVLRNNTSMDLWINEGLSSAAEYIYLGSHVPDRYEWFKEDPKGTIAKGNNFFVWGNYTDNSILDDYATVYLFFQWLRIQGGTAIYKSIIGSSYSDYRALTKLMKPHLSTMAGELDWGGLLKTWMAANYINASSGPYGYKNDSKLSTLKAKTAPVKTTSLQLLPGEGVYSIVKNGSGVSSSGSGPNIKYAYLYRINSGLVSDTPGGALLTYNANINKDGAPETGRLTGAAADVSAASGVSLARSLANTAREGPVSIDARDILARNGQSGEAHGE